MSYHIYLLVLRVYLGRFSVIHEKRMFSANLSNCGGSFQVGHQQDSFSPCSCSHFVLDDGEFPEGP